MKAAADTTAGDALGQLLGVDMMDAGRYFAALGDTAEQMYRPIREGFDKRAWKLRETVEWTQALLKDKTDVDKWTGRKAEKRKFTVTDAASMADTVLELTPGQAMELYCLSQRGGEGAFDDRRHPAEGRQGQAGAAGEADAGAAGGDYRQPDDRAGADGTRHAGIPEHDRGGVGQRGEQHAVRVRQIYRNALLADEQQQRLYRHNGSQQQAGRAERH